MLQSLVRIDYLGIKSDNLCCLMSLNGSMGLVCVVFLRLPMSHAPLTHTSATATQGATLRHVSPNSLIATKSMDFLLCCTLFCTLSFFNYKN